ncbi:MAG: M42 family metallopeptidase [Bacilli bacterium]
MDILKNLSELDGIPGHEGSVRKYVRDKFLEIGIEEIRRDGLGSIIGKLPGDEGGPKIILAGHMDEIGLMVTKITEEGFLKFQPVGGWWSHVLLAQEFTVTTAKGGRFRAVVGAKAPHLLSPEERAKTVDVEEMFLDIGVKDRAEAESLGIRVGDMAAPARSFAPLANPKYLLGKAWDDRIGVAVFLEVLRRLKDENHPNVVYAVGSVQEEVGLRGAKTSGHLVNPDIAFAIDVTVAKDAPKMDNSLKLGAGPAILIYDRSLIAHVGLRETVQKIAAEEGIPFQLDYLVRGGTDAGAISLVHAGVPSLALCIPARYIHSHVSIIHRDDYENMVNLLVTVIKRLDRKTVEKIIYD